MAIHNFAEADLSCMVVKLGCGGLILSARECELSQQPSIHLSVGLLCPLQKHLQDVGLQDILLPRIKGRYKSILTMYREFRKWGVGNSLESHLLISPSDFIEN